MRSISAEIAKDKRTLVLFVLGFLLIGFDLWNSVSLEDKTKQWPMLSSQAAGGQGNAIAKGLLGSKEHIVAATSLSPGQETANTNPAALSLFFNRPLPINTADKETLEMLPGVGPHLAASIANELQRQGRFTGPEDLLKVPGIGPKSLQRLLPLISFE